MIANPRQYPERIRIVTEDEKNELMLDPVIQQVIIDEQVNLICAFKCLHLESNVFKKAKETFNLNWKLLEMANVPRSHVYSLANAKHGFTYDFNSRDEVFAKHEIESIKKEMIALQSHIDDTEGDLKQRFIDDLIAETKKLQQLTKGSN